MTRIAIIGCGRQAPKHISGFRQVPDVEVVVADRHRERAAALAEREGVPAAGGVDEVFADPGVAAVDICTPTRTHATLVRQALAAGKDFFCEKPLCETAAEARELLSLAERARLIGMVGYIYRFAPTMMRARAILDGAPATGRSPALGRLTACTLRLGARDTAAAWKYRRDHGGGAVLEMLVHMLDLAHWLFGAVTAAEVLVEEVLRAPIDGGGAAEDFVMARCHTEAGVPVFIQADLVTPSFTHFLEVQGDNGTLMASIRPDMPQFVDLIEAAGGYAAGRTDIGSGPSNIYAAQLASFVRAIRDRTPPDRCTLHDNLRVMETLEMIRRQRRSVA